MFMGTARDAASKLAIHLYKHYDTRRCLNLDEAGHAYAYCGGGSIDDDGVISAGWYRRYVSLADAIEHLEFSIYDTHPGFIRSLPPDTGPADERAEHDNRARCRRDRQLVSDRTR